MQTATFSSPSAVRGITSRRLAAGAKRGAAQAFARVRGSSASHGVSAWSMPCDGRAGARMGVRARITPDNIRDFDGGYGKPKRSSQGGTSSTIPKTPPAPATPPPSLEALLADLSLEEQRTVRLFQDNSRSVVNVSTTVNAVSLLQPFSVQQVPRGVGSGFVWDDKGHVITNAHVVAGAAEVSVTLSNGQSAKAKVIGRSREKDIAVLQITDGLTPEQMAGLRPVVLGSSSNLLVGQKVFAIGNPFGLDQTLTQGIVSGLGREVGGGGFAGGSGTPTITNAIQTDAAINPGNSGGPLLDSRGRVVGINTAILDPTGVGISSGVGFAIPIDAVSGMVQQILTTGRVVRPALGISIAPVPPMFGRGGAYGGGSSNGNGGANGSSSSSTAGVLVVSVRPGGPADVAGVQGTRREGMFGAVRLGDVIVAINSKPIKSQKDLFATLDNYKVGDAVELALVNGAGARRTVRVVLADRDKLEWSE